MMKHKRNLMINNLMLNIKQLKNEWNTKQLNNEWVIKQWMSHKRTKQRMKHTKLLYDKNIKK